SELRQLKARAQRLDPSVKLGRAGLTPDFLAALDTELARHGLVKVKFTEFKDQRREMAREMAARTGSHLVWVVGHVAVLFRRLPPATPATPAKPSPTAARPAA
ncbi:MAG: YhbY family RNA-binding protein, partial [Verrucomicrobiota bacterium]